METWLPTEFPGYEVSDLGRVRSRFRVLAPFIRSNRYLAFHASVRNVSRKVSLARAICTAFHGAPFDGAQCAHLDGDTLNNRADNLAWTTAKENNSHKVAHGTLLTGESHPRARLTASLVRDLRARHEAGASIRSLARDLGMGFSPVARAVRGDTWKEVA